ncbi:MAG TPA: hypothetical protein VNX18_05460 [Bryobacteraceae bacterium]|nr:hypothetical protein [Bryobacteraceae bacterium]
MKTSVSITDLATGKPVEAVLFDDVTLEHFLEAQREWRPVVVEAAQRLVKAGEQEYPRHWHWDWSTKEADLKVLAYGFLGIAYEGRLQGLLKLETAGRSSRIDAQKGKPLVYVDYVETAPWNIKLITSALGTAPKFGGIGTRLIEAAVRRSLEEGFKGRLGLHSLSISERFYLKACGMTAVAKDPTKQNLLWCEFTPEQAEKFLAGGAA